MPADDTGPIAATVSAWAEAWRAGAPQQILNLWDKADPESRYLAADRVDAPFGPAVIGFVQRRCIDARCVHYGVQHLHLRRLGADLGLAFFELERATIMNGVPAPSATRVRVTMLMRERAGTWRVFDYAEAPLAPLLELQTYYEAVAADGFEGMSRWDAAP